VSEPLDRPGRSGRPFRILELGGSSLSAPDGLERVCHIVQERLAHARPVLVASAFAETPETLLRALQHAAAGTTSDWKERLYRAHRAAAEHVLGDDGKQVFRRLEVELDQAERLLHGVRLVRECPPKARNAVLALGERMSAIVVAAALRRAGVDAHHCDARWLMSTDRRSHDPSADFTATSAAARAYLARSRGVQVVTGGTGATPTGEATRLGPSGADITAAVLASALDAEAVEIWSDGPGIMSADPHMVPSAFPLARLSYDELIELSHWGGQLLHPAALRLLRSRRIPLEVRGTECPEAPGTRVSRERSSATLVQSVASVERVAIVRIEGPALSRAAVIGRLFSNALGSSTRHLFAAQGSGEASVCLALRREELPRVLDALDEEFRLERATGDIERVRADEDHSIIAVVGEGIGCTPGIAARAFGALDRHGINASAAHQGSSELSLSFAVSAERLPPALRAVHDAFFTTSLTTV
jgi:aspartokinase/homoserine dehydrogenase 1